ncbi:phakinin [Mesoplodon densirostris]|uniref:phakinin n=1 Tax=Mesoplodon densirostris TaxID=48708 RepID=UPI0028DCD12D|nr:phakinin [Mesoplodon densirostris]
MSTRRVVVDAPAGASSSMPLQRHKASFRGAQSSSSLDSLPASRTIAVGGLARTPRVYVGMTPSGCTGGLGARVTRRALGISSVFLQGLRSSGLATAPTPGLERDLSAVEDLGGCLVEYMAKVHALEKVSQELEAQLRMHLDSKTTRSESCSALRASWTSSCQQVGDAVLENARLMLQTENIQAGADDFKERYENEQPFRKAAEEEINSLYKVIDEANSTKKDLESQIESLKEELGFLSRSYEEDVKMLYKQLAGSELEQLDVPIGTGLDDILETIRVHWERDVEKKWAEAGALLQAKQQTEVARRAQTQEEKLAAALRVEMHNTSCQIQSLQAETESLRALKRGLENTLHDAKHWHDIELQNLGAVVSRLEAELREMRTEAEQQLQAREHLLAHKCQMQRDVASYHALLDREESRVSSSWVYQHKCASWARVVLVAGKIATTGGKSNVLATEGVCVYHDHRRHKRPEKSSRRTPPKAQTGSISRQASGDGPGAASGHQGQRLDRRAGLRAQEGQGEPEHADTSSPVTASNHDDIQK